MGTAARASSGITAIGVAAPTLRITAAEIGSGWGRSGGRSQVAVCGADEDPLTLAWQAADRALTAAASEPEEIEGLWWGCTRLPFAEGPSLSMLAAALRLPPSTHGALLSGSPHAGMDALLAAADALAAGRVATALVVASDALLPMLGSGFEAACGAGAVAVVLGPDAAARLGASVTQCRPVLDRYRGHEEPETRDVYDGRLFREQVFLPLCSEVAGALGASGDARWSLPDPDGRLGPALARRLDVDTEAAGTARARLGDTGAAAALLGLASMATTPGPAAVLAYGGGRATALSIQLDEPIPGADRVADDLSGGRQVTYAEVLRARGQLRAGGETVEMAVPPGSAMLVRGGTEILGLLGARCRACGTLNTPPDVHPACIACGGTEFDLVPVPRRGAVQTFVVNRTMPAPFVAPLPLVVIDLDGGSRLMVQGAGDGADLRIGEPVELVLRRYALERGVPVYGYKAAVVAAGAPRRVEEVAR